MLFVDWIADFNRGIVAEMPDNSVARSYSINIYAEALGLQESHDVNEILCFVLYGVPYCRQIGNGLGRTNLSLNF